MKKMMYIFGFIVISITINSCSSDNTEKNEDATAPVEQIGTGYTYNDSELETMKLINEYRVSIGLKALIATAFISNQCLDHNKYMIANNVMDHHDFDLRSDAISKELKAVSVAENVAFNYKTSESVVKGWLDSPGHKKNIEGDYTHFGLAVTIDSKGQKHYTNMFAKI